MIFFSPEEFTSKTDIFEQGGLEPLIHLLSSPDCDVQVKEMFLISNFLVHTLLQNIIKFCF